MRIAICATGKDFNSPVDERFGRCSYFVLVNENGNQIDTLKNSAMNSPQGAGIATAQLMVNNQVDTVLVGRMGPKAMKPLQSAGIKVYTGISGTVKDSLENFKNGKLKVLEEANSPDYGGSNQMQGGR